LGRIEVDTRNPSSNFEQSKTNKRRILRVGDVGDHEPRHVRK
jgi:hypothetical protein